MFIRCLGNFSNRWWCFNKYAQHKYFIIIAEYRILNTFSTVKFCYHTLFSVHDVRSLSDQLAERHLHILSLKNTTPISLIRDCRYRLLTQPHGSHRDATYLIRLLNWRHWGKSVPSRDETFFKYTSANFLYYHGLSYKYKSLHLQSIFLHAVNSKRCYLKLVHWNNCIQ